MAPKMQNSKFNFKMDGTKGKCFGNVAKLTSAGESRSAVSSNGSAITP